MEISVKITKRGEQDLYLQACLPDEEYRFPIRFKDVFQELGRAAERALIIKNPIATRDFTVSEALEKIKESGYKVLKEV